MKTILFVQKQWAAHRPYIIAIFIILSISAATVRRHIVFYKSVQALTFEARARAWLIREGYEQAIAGGLIVNERAQITLDTFTTNSLARLSATLDSIPVPDPPK